MASTEDVLASALELPARARARIAYELLRSLDDQTDVDATQEWTSELSNRLQQVKNGEVELVSLDEVKKRMAQRRAERGIALKGE
ncbi:MAG: addiction module protein [Proteobacteria bacterium]|nr:addiction module protein [Pseudomonadota bacterium]